MGPPFFDPNQIAPEPSVWGLLDKRERIIHSALLGGHDYDAALRFAKQHVPDEQIEAARERDRKDIEAWNQRRQQPSERTWLAAMCGWPA